MANDPEAKRLADWKAALEKYLCRLEEMVEELRNNAEVVPAVDILKGPCWDWPSDSARGTVLPR